MQGSPSSSERRAARRRVRGASVLIVFLLVIVAGCRTVRPEEKEYLSEPSMTWSSGGLSRAHETHVLENREGSSGGTTAKGGGCGCN